MAKPVPHKKRFLSWSSGSIFSELLVLGKAGEEGDDFGRNFIRAGSTWEADRSRTQVCFQSLPPYHFAILLSWPFLCNYTRGTKYNEHIGILHRLVWKLVTLCFIFHHILRGYLKSVPKNSSIGHKTKWFRKKRGKDNNTKTGSTNSPLRRLY